MKYEVNHRVFEYHSIGEKLIGDHRILLHNDVDLTREMPWHKDGFAIHKLFTKDQYPNFISGAENQLLSAWADAGLNVPANFKPGQYHTLLNTQEDHLRAINFTKLISVREFPIDIKILEEAISKILRQPLRVHNPFDEQEVFHYRVIRPQSGDYNPLHRDIWLDDYKDCINLYIPIVGSNEKSSLIIAKGSHLWSESNIERTSNGAQINGHSFNVPAVTQILREVEFVRPNPQENEVLIFSPYLIHGGSVNLNQDETRISIEIRLWRK